MSVSSLRPERSASANFATSAEQGAFYQFGLKSQTAETGTTVYYVNFLNRSGWPEQLTFPLLAAR